MSPKVKWWVHSGPTLMYEHARTFSVTIEYELHAATHDGRDLSTSKVVVSRSQSSCHREKSLAWVCHCTGNSTCSQSAANLIKLSTPAPSYLYSKALHENSPYSIKVKSTRKYLFPVHHSLMRPFIALSFSAFLPSHFKSTL